MKTCPNCGAENRQTAAECRLCAAPLESPDHLLGARMESPFPDEIPASAIISGREPEHASVPSPGGDVACPTCQGFNDPDWVFCQYCGNRLPAREAPREGAAISPPAAAEAAVPPPTRQPGAARSSVAPVAAAAAGVAHCTACGKAGSTGALYCAYCGKPMAADAGKEHQRVEAGKPVIQIISEGGQVGETYSVGKGGALIGRVEGDATFPHDGYLSSRHARVVDRGGRYFLVDLDSRNGTFIRIKEEVELKPGDTFLVGKQLFKFDKK